jgi:subtilase family serine protease
VARRGASGQIDQICLDPVEIADHLGVDAEFLQPAPAYQAGHEGQGTTIAIIDSFGNPNMASDLANFSAQMGLPHMNAAALVPALAGR